jgi:hypothetical protein
VEMGGDVVSVFLAGGLNELLWPLACSSDKAVVPGDGESSVGVDEGMWGTRLVGGWLRHMWTNYLY